MYHNIRIVINADAADAGRGLRTVVFTAGIHSPASHLTAIAGQKFSRQQQPGSFGCVCGPAADAPTEPLKDCWHNQERNAVNFRDS